MMIRDNGLFHLFRKCGCINASTCGKHKMFSVMPQDLEMSLIKNKTQTAAINILNLFILIMT